VTRSKNMRPPNEIGGSWVSSHIHIAQNAHFTPLFRARKDHPHCARRNVHYWLSHSASQPMLVPSRTIRPSHHCHQNRKKITERSEKQLERKPKSDGPVSRTHAISGNVKTEEET
jgi:hypothetical protein